MAGRDTGSVAVRVRVLVAVRISFSVAVGGCCPLSGCPGHRAVGQLYAAPYLTQVAQWDNCHTPHSLSKSPGFVPGQSSPDVLPFTSAAPAPSACPGLHVASGCSGLWVLLNPRGICISVLDGGGVSQLGLQGVAEVCLCCPVLWGRFCSPSDKGASSAYWSHQSVNSEG